MADYKSSIGISIKLDPQNKVKGDLEQLLNKLNQTSTLNINLNPKINQQLKEVTNNLNNIYKQTDKPFTLNSLTKSAEESAKVFQNIGEEIGKLHEKSEIKSQKIDRTQELNQAKAINRALEDGYKLEQEKQMMLNHQVELYKQIGVLEKNGFLNESDISKLKEMVNSLEKMKDMHNVMNSIKDATNKESSIVSISKQLDNAQFKLDKMKKTFEGKLPDGFLQSTQSELNKIKDEFKNVDGTNFNNIKNSLNQVNSNMRSVSEQAKSTEGFFSKLGNSLKNVGIYIDITDVVRGVTNNVKEAVDTVIKMDSALGSLNKVVSMSSSQLQQMRDSAIEMGKELGRSSIEIANAQAEFGRLYKTQNEINNMTKVSVMGANVMDGVTSAEVAKGLTTVISSMKLEAKDSMDILDSMNEIQNNYRVGANDLLNALAEVGSTAYTSGTNLKQVEGYITSIAVATGKSGDEIGNSLKSIMSRVYKLGEEGLESEGKPEKMLNDMGVAVRDASGNFRDFSAILSDLDVKWRNMSNTEKIATAQVVGGVHRYNDFMSLMNNYQMALDSTNTALNSQGSALKENEIHLQTAEAKLGILKATTEEFFMKLINSDAIKSTIDGLTTLVSTFGNLPTIVGLATSALVLFKGEAIVGAISSIYGYITSLISLASTEGIVATATGELSLVMATNPFGLIAIAIASVTVGLVAMNKYLEESTDYIGKMNEATKGLQEMRVGENLVKQYNDLNAVINNTSSTTEQVTSAKEKLIGVQKQLASQFPNLVDGYTKEGDALVRNIGLVEEKINKDKKMLVAQAESNYGNLINQITDKQMNKFNDTTSDAIWWLPSTWKSDIESYNNLIKESENSESGLSEARKEKLTELSTKFGDLNKAILTMKENGQDINGKQMFDFSTGQLVDASKYLKDIEQESQQVSDKTRLVSNAMKELNLGANLSSDTINKLSQAYPDLGINASNAKDKIAELNRTLSDGNSSGNMSIEKANEAYNDATISIAKIQSFIDKLNKTQAVTPQIAGQISKAYQDVGTNINGFGSTIDFLKDKIEEQQQVQEDALMIMKGDDESFYAEKIKNNQEYENQINSFLSRFTGNSEDAYTIDLGNYQSLNQMKAGAQTTLKGAVDAFMSQFVDTSASAYKIDYSNFSNLISAKKAVMQQMAGAMAQFWDETSQGFSEQAYGGVDLSGNASDATYEAYQKKAQGILNIRDKIRSAESKLDGIYAGGGLNFQGFSGGAGGGGVSDFGGSGGGSGGSGADKALKEAVKNEKDYLDDLGEKYEDVKNMIESNVSDIELAEGELGDTTEDNYVQKVQLLSDKIKQQSWLLDEAKENLNLFTNASVSTDDAQESLKDSVQKATKEVSSQKKALAELNEQMKKMATDSIKSLIEQEQKLAEAQLENKQKNETKQLENNSYKFSEDEYKDYIESRKEYLSNQISDLEDLKDEADDTTAIQEAINENQEELNSLTDKNYSTIQNTQKLYEKIQEQRKSDLQDEIKSIDDKISALEEEKNAQDEANELAEKQNAITEAQTNLTEKQIALEKLKNQKNIQSYQQQEDGSWNFAYVADQEAIKSAQDEVNDAKSSLDDANKSLQDYKDEQAYQKEVDALNEQKNLLQDQIDAIEELTNKKSEKYEEDLKNLQDNQEKEKTALENSYSDMDKLVETRFEELKKTYGDNWTEIINDITTKTQSAQSELDKITKLNLSYTVDMSGNSNSNSDSNSYGSSNGDSNSSSNSSSTSVTGLVKSQYDDIKEYGDKIVTAKNEYSEKAYNVDKDYSDKTVALQKQTQSEQLANDLAFLQTQNEVTESMMKTLLLVYDEFFGDIVNVASLSTEEMLKQLQVMQEAFNSYVTMYNKMHKDDEDFESMSKVDISSILKDYQTTQAGLTDYISAKALLYDTVTSNSLSASGLLDTTGLSSIANANGNNLNALTTTTNNSNSNNTTFNISGITVQSDNIQSFLDSVTTIATQNVKTK